jgi:hypothetical protein
MSYFTTSIKDMRGMKISTSITTNQFEWILIALASELWRRRVVWTQRLFEKHTASNTKLHSITYHKTKVYIHALHISCFMDFTGLDIIVLHIKIKCIANSTWQNTNCMIKHISLHVIKHLQQWPVFQTKFVDLIPIVFEIMSF